MSSETMTIRLRKDVKDGLARIASATRRTNSFLAAEAIEAYVEREAAIIDGVRRGLDDIEASRLVPHDEAIARLEAVIASAAQPKA